MSETPKDDIKDLAYKNGARWESYIRKECFALRRADRAVVRKNWEAPPIPGKPRDHQKREKSKPDFSGFLPGGRHVCFEAKATFSKTSFAFKYIEDHQLAHLRSAHEYGASAFVYVCSAAGKWLLPIPVIDATIEGGAASFSFQKGDRRLMKRRGETWLDTWIRLENEGLT